MTHPETEVVEPVSSLSDDQAAAAFDDIFSDDVDDDGEPEAEPVEGEVEDDPDPDEVDEDQPGEDEDGEDDGEPAEPAIPAPASFNAEEKAVYATMTPEQQRTVAAIEQRRNGDVTRATQAAAEAKRNAITEAQGQLAQIQRQYAEDVERRAMEAQAFIPQKPAREFRHVDPQGYDRMLDAYEDGQAYLVQMQRQAAYARQQADEQEAANEQAFVQQQRSILLNAIPDWNDNAKRTELLNNLASVAEVYGYEGDRIADADATDIIALKNIAADRAELLKLRERVAKFDAKNMAHVRSFKGKPPVAVQPGIAQSKGSGQRKAFAESMSRLRSSGNDDDAVSAMRALGL